MGPGRLSRKDRGIAYTTASRSIRLHQQYAEINQLGEFDSVSVALTRRRSARPRRAASPYLVSLDDLWDWEQWGPSAIEGVVRQYIEESETREELFNALVCFRLALSCQMDFGPYENDPGARAETG